VLGVGAYRTAFALPKAAVGPLPDPIGGSRAWLLPNPSGLNAHYQLGGLAEAFAALRRSLG
jgi:double-stranded uracil-DNA glycosylase